MNIHRKERGFILLYVVVAITLVAAIAFALSNQGVNQTNIASGELQRDQLRYVAEAGMAHAQLQLSPSDTCDSYVSIPSTPFGAGSYAANVTPAEGSPVSIFSTGTLANGARHTLSRNNVKVYSATATQAMTLELGAEGKDTYIEVDKPNENYGSDGILMTDGEISGAGPIRSLLRFDLSSIPSSRAVTSAQLSLFVTDDANTPPVVEAHRLLKSWTEGGAGNDGATWNTTDGSTAWTNPGTDYDPTVEGSFIANGLGWKSLYITSLVQGWVDGSIPNDGMVLLSPPASGNNEITYHSSDVSDPTLRPKLTINVTCECGLPCADDTNTFYLSTDGEADLGGLNFLDKDLAEYDRAADVGTLFFDSAATGMGNKIDALHVLENGHLLFSVDGDTTFGGLAFKKEDLVEYDPVAGTATMFLEAEVHFQSKQNIVSVHMLDNGNIVLSTAGSATLGGLAFSDKDIVEYNRDTGQASIFFDGDATTLSKKIFALHVLGNGHIVMAADGDTTLGGLSFGPDQLIDYDPVADTATLFFDGETLFSSTGEKVTAVHVGAGSGEIEEYYAARNILFVVGDATSLTSEELDHQAIIEIWGHTVEILGADASQAEFDAAVLRNDVAFTTNDIESTSLGNKLVDANIGVVTSEDNLSDEFGMSSSIGWDSGTSLDIDDNTDYITSPFPLGPLTILTASESLAYVTGTLSPDLGQLASTSSGSGLVTLGTGAAMVGGGTAAGPRVQLPWGGAGFDPNNLTEDGLTILRRALEWAAADILHLSTDSDAILGGLSFLDTDLARYNTVTDVAALFLDSAAAGLSEKIDALHVLENGHLLLSVGTDTTFAGLTFKTEDLIDYDPIAGTATMFLEAALLFESKQNIVSVHVLANGNVVLSTAGSATLGGLDFSDKDLVEYDRDTGQASIFFDGDATTLSKKIYAVHILNNGHIVLAPDGDTTLGGLSVGPDQLIDYDPATDTATLFFDGSTLFTETSEEIAALHIGPGSGSIGRPTGSTYRDNFDTQNSYAGSDGTLTWSTNWLEINESDGAGSGDVKLADDASKYQLQIQDNDGGGEGLEREANLSTCATATLTFDYRRASFDDSNDYVTIDVSNNGGSSWTELDRLTGPANESAYTPTSYDLSGAMATNTRIRFLGSPLLGGSDKLFIDNVQIICEP